MTRHGMVAWLVTWEGTNPAERLAAILHHRTNERCIPTIIELLYALCGHVDDLASYARKPGSNPYPASDDGNAFVCGHNPWLYARLVDKLRVETDSARELQTITWMERPGYELVERKAPAGPKVKERVPARPGKIERKAVPLWRVG